MWGATGIYRRHIIYECDDPFYLTLILNKGQEHWEEEDMNTLRVSCFKD